ncbi:MAG TPA: hypothetical protein VH012_04690 [Acidimicrobiales bacterium]|nr:hypothetical protein [Acidimicrobiales bacterium]
MAKRRTDPGLTTIKNLFAVSHNHCAFRDPEDKSSGCEVKLTDRKWKQVKARICHIRGEAPTSARYDESMTDKERRHFDNLILLCPNHHSQIDDCEPERFTVEVLTEIKRKAEEAAEAWELWATDDLLNHAAEALQLTMQRLSGLQRLQPVSMMGTAATTGTATATLTATATGTATPASADVSPGVAGVRVGVPGPTGPDNPAPRPSAENGPTGPIANPTARASVNLGGPTGPVAAANPTARASASAGGLVRPIPAAVAEARASVDTSGSSPTTDGEADIESPLLIQIRQIVGYDKITDMSKDATGTLVIQLSDTPSSETQVRLEVLAEEQGETFRYHFGDSYVVAQPANSD